MSEFSVVQHEIIPIQAWPSPETRDEYDAMYKTAFGPYGYAFGRGPRQYQLFLGVETLAAGVLVEFSRDQELGAASLAAHHFTPYTSGFDCNVLMFSSGDGDRAATDRHQDRIAHMVNMGLARLLAPYRLARAED